MYLSTGQLKALNAISQMAINIITEAGCQHGYRHQSQYNLDNITGVVVIFSRVLGVDANFKFHCLNISCVDWEVELAVIIGKRTKCIQIDQAYDYIFGYTIAQDISSRDWQKRRNGGQFLLGKSMDTFWPLGPCVVTRNKIQDPHNLDIKCWVNGTLKQNRNTRNMVFKIDYLVSYLSQIMTLLPGDVILTGTPAGVGLHRHPPEFLKPGDLLESEIQGIGKMKNIIV